MIYTKLTDIQMIVFRKTTQLRDFLLKSINISNIIEIVYLFRSIRVLKNS
jgi:hypothetical protein